MRRDDRGQDGSASGTQRSAHRGAAARRGAWTAGGLLAAACLLAGSARAAEPAASDWPQFLGPQRNGLSTETGLLDKLPLRGPRVLWKVPSDVGQSGLAVASGQVATMWQQGGKQRLIVLSATDGKVVHDVPLAPDYRNAQGNGPRCTPTFHDGTWFAMTGEGVLAAVDAKTGALAWQHDACREAGGRPQQYGMACSPLVVGSAVVVFAGTQEATIVAYDRTSGQRLWTAGSGPGGYSSPMLLDVAGAKQIVAFGGAAALGIAPSDGHVLWTYPYKTDFDCNVANPIGHAGQVLISSGENHGSALLAPTGDGAKQTVRETWTSFGPQSVLRQEWQTSLLIDGHLYGYDNVGSAGPVTHLTCVEVATGTRKWQKLRFGKGNLIGADGKIFANTLEGDLVLIKANPAKYEELGRAGGVPASRQAPALSGGRLYLRDEESVVCYDVKKS